MNRRALALHCDTTGCSKRIVSSVIKIKELQEIARRNGWESTKINAKGETFDVCPGHHHERSR